MDSSSSSSVVASSSQEAQDLGRVGGGRSGQALPGPGDLVPVVWPRASEGAG